MGILDKLKKNRQDVFEKTKTAASESGRGGFKSEFWSPEMAKGSDTTSVTIRFLPAKDPEDVPYVSIYEHFFKGDDDRWLKTLCPTTFGEDCPVWLSSGTVSRHHASFVRYQSIVAARPRSKSGNEGCQPSSVRSLVESIA